MHTIETPRGKYATCTAQHSTAQQTCLPLTRLWSKQAHITWKPASATAALSLQQHLIWLTCWRWAHILLSTSPLFHLYFIHFVSLLSALLVAPGGNKSPGWNPSRPSAILVAETKRHAYKKTTTRQFRCHAEFCKTESRFAGTRGSAHRCCLTHCHNI